MMVHDGRNIVGLPLVERRRRLRELVGRRERVECRFAADFLTGRRDGYSAAAIRLAVDPSASQR